MAGYTPTRTFTAAERETMIRVTTGLATKAAKIRALKGAGYTRSTIAAFLGISYQHVRSTLGTSAAVAPPNATASITYAAADDEDRGFGVLQVTPDGSIRLSAALLQALEAEPGKNLLWTLDGDVLTLMGRRSGLRYIQDDAQKYKVEGEEDWSLQLIHERREEAAREDAEDRAL